jgi:hypothetical protein
MLGASLNDSVINFYIAVASHRIERRFNSN